MTSRSPLERIEAFLVAVRTLEVGVDDMPVALGWATVELDRAVGELADAIGVPAGRFTDGADDELLGARCRVAHDGGVGGRSLVVLEPATEGRLAATLARHGEGPAAIWFATTEAFGATGASSLATATLSSPRTGPFGIERLVLGGPIHGPHRLVVGPPGTIRP